MLLEKSWEELSYGLKMRVLELVIALCKYQTLVHPREINVYLEDVTELDAIRALLNRCTLTTEYPLDRHLGKGRPSSASTDIPGKALSLYIRAVISDTLLSSTAWFH